MSPPERLNAKAIRINLGDVTIGREVIVQDEVNSTNDSIWQLASVGADEGVVVFAEHQLAGRGQRANVWESPPRKALLLSILLCPQLKLKDSPRLAEWAANVVASTIEKHLRIPATVKLPNDVYVAGRKVAGVLVEMRATAEGHVAILGIGINANQLLDDFSAGLRQRATSLAMILSGDIDRQALAIALLRQLDSTYRQLF